MIYARGVKDLLCNPRYWSWLETFAAGRPFKADDEFSEDESLQIHFEPPVLLDAPHGNATVSGSWPASPTIFRRLGATRGGSTAIFAGPQATAQLQAASPGIFCQHTSERSGC